MSTVTPGEAPGLFNGYGYARPGLHYLGTWDTGSTEHIAFFDPEADELVELNGPSGGLNWGQTISGMNHRAGPLVESDAIPPVGVPGHIVDELRRVRPPDWQRPVPVSPVPASEPAPPPAAVSHPVSAPTFAQARPGRKTYVHPRRALVPTRGREDMRRFEEALDVYVTRYDSDEFMAVRGAFALSLHTMCVTLALWVLLTPGAFPEFAAVLLLADAVFGMWCLRVLVAAALRFIVARLVFGSSLIAAGLVSLPGTALAFLGRFGSVPFRPIGLSDIVGSFLAAGLMMIYGAAALYIAWCLFMKSDEELRREYLGRRSL